MEETSQSPPPNYSFMKKHLFKFRKLCLVLAEFPHQLHYLFFLSCKFMHIC